MNGNLLQALDLPRFSPGREHGLSLVELMVGMALGMVVVAAVGYIYINGLSSYRMQEALTRMQDSGRFAFEIIAKDLRMAGSDACGASERANVVAASNWYLNLYSTSGTGSGGLKGYEASTPGAPAVGLSSDGVATSGSGAALNDRDAIAVIHADNAVVYSVSSHNVGTGVFTLSAASNLQKGDILVACSHDGKQSAVFQMTGPGTANPSTVEHKTGVVGVTPGNCTINLGHPVAPVASGCVAATNPAALQTGVGDTGTAYMFQNGSRIMPLSSVIYFVRNNPAGIPALYRQKLGTASGVATPVPEELVEGVEDMQIEYGIDDVTGNDSADGGLKVEDYVEADSVTDWRRVVSVRIRLLMRTSSDWVTDAGTTNKYIFKDTNGDDVINSDDAVTASDHYLRKIVSHVVRVRNRN